MKPSPKYYLDAQPLIPEEQREVCEAMPIARAIAVSMARKLCSVSEEDLVAQAYLCLCKGIPHWDPRRGKLSTFVYLYLPPHLTEYIRKRLTGSYELRGYEPAIFVPFEDPVVQLPQDRVVDAIQVIRDLGLSGDAVEALADGPDSECGKVVATIVRNTTGRKRSWPKTPQLGRVLTRIMGQGSDWTVPKLRTEVVKTLGSCPSRVTVLSYLHKIGATQVSRGKWNLKSP